MCVVVSYDREENILRKVLSVIVIIAMLAASFIGFGTVALAADVDFDVVSNVTELLVAGNVEFTATVVNNTSSTIYPTEISYTCNGQSFSEAYDAPILSGDQAQIVFTRLVTEEMIGKQFSFSFKSDAPGPSPTDTLTITRKVATIKLAASGTSNKTLVAMDEIITFSFALENQGEATITDIVVKAPELNSGKALRTAFSLEPTQGYTVVYKHTMVKEIIVNPVVTYKVNGVAQPTIVLAPIELKLESRSVEIELSVDNKTPNFGEEVTFTLRIANSGNVKYTNLKLTMNGEEVVFPAGTLNPGNSYTEVYKRSYTVSTDVSFTVSLKDHKGATVSATSNTISILLPVDEADLQAKLRFSMNVDRPHITTAGTVTFTGTITNASVENLTDISIDEESLGNVFSATELAASATKKIEFTADINETTTYNFVLSVKDRNGKVFLVSAEPIEVTISSVAPTPTPFDDAAEIDDEENVLTINDGKGGSLGPLGVVAIVLAALILTVGIALMVMWKRGKSSPRSAPGGSSGRSSASGRKPAARRPIGGRKPAKKPTRSYRDRNHF